MKITDRLMNWLVILTSLAVLLFVADDFSGKRIRRALGPKPSPLDWSHVQFPSEALPSPGAKAVFLVLSTQCGVCIREVPKYRELAQRIKSDVPTTKFVTVFVQPGNEAQQFLKDQEFDVPTVEVPSLIQAVHATPTILLVDDHGKVAEYWVGAGAISTEKLISQIKKG